MTTHDTVSIAIPTLALVSEATFLVDGESRPGVITVHRYKNDHIEISIQPLHQLPYPIALEVILDTIHLAHIKCLLDAQDRAAAPPSDPSNPPDPSDCRTNQTRLDTLDNEYVTLCQAIDDIRRRLAEIESAVRITDRVMNDTFNQHQARLDGQFDRINILADQIGSVARSTGAADSNAEAQIDALEQRLDRVWNALREHGVPLEVYNATS